MDEGERVLAPIREVTQPVMDMVQPMPYVALQSMLDAGGPHGTRAYMKAEFLPELSDDAIEKLARHGAARPGPLVQLLLEPMGGAISRWTPARLRSPCATCRGATTHSRCWMEPDDDTADAHVAWGRGLSQDMASHATAGVYLNYTSDEGDDRVREMYGPELYDRLVALKDRYDPDNVFRLNQNIRPSSGG